jgi:hypothetical protein
MLPGNCPVSISPTFLYNTRMKILAALIILTALSLSAVAQSGQKMVVQSTDGDRPYSFDSLLLAKAKITSPELLNDIGFVRYTALLMRTLDGDTTVDFSRMRFWFTQTKKYDPFALAGAAKLTGFRDSMYLAYTAKNWRTVRDFAGKILQREFCDIDAQSLASTSNLQLGDTILAKVQGWTAHRLLESIKSSGDGLSPQTAYKLISVAEQRPFLAYLGYTGKNVESVVIDSRTLDKVTARKNDSKKETEIWFDVTLPYRHLDQAPDSLKQKLLAEPKR